MVRLRRISCGIYTKSKKYNKWENHLIYVHTKSEEYHFCAQEKSLLLFVRMKSLYKVRKLSNLYTNKVVSLFCASFLVPRSCCQPATHERSDSTAAIGIFYFLNCLFLRTTFLLQLHSGYQMLTIPFPDLIDKAQRIYSENFPPTTLFERAIFFSWGFPY